MRRGQGGEDVVAAQSVVRGNPDQVEIAAAPARVLHKDGEHLRVRPLPGAHVGHGHASAGDHQIRRRPLKHSDIERIDRTPGRQPAVEIARRDASHLVGRAERLDDAQRVDLMSDPAGAQQQRAQG